MNKEQVNIELKKIGFEQFKIEKRYQRLKPKTIENHWFSLAMFVSFLLEKNSTTDDVEPNIIMQYFNEKEEKQNWSKYTAWTQFKNLRAYFNWCVEKGIFKENPFLKMEPITQPSPSPKALSEEDVKVLLRTIKQMPYEYRFTKLRNIALVYTYFYSGLRRQELCNLKVEDVDLKSGFINVYRGKWDKSRIVAIQKKELLPDLLKYFEYRNKLYKTSRWFFNGTFSNRGKNDNKLSVGTIERLFRDLSRETGIHVSPQILRHSFATIYLDKTDNLYQLQEAMGHNELSTTSVYLKMITRKKIECMDKLTLGPL
jgi:integrase/recombinase XerD